MGRERRMALRAWLLVLLAYTLGWLVPCASGSSVDTSCSIYYKSYPSVGHAVSYNYPLRHSYSDAHTYNYRLFPDTYLWKTLCLTVHQFDIDTESTFTIFAPTATGTTKNFEYTGHGERMNRLDDSTLPLNIWSEFCVELHGDESLKITFVARSTKLVPGFHIVYSAHDDDQETEAGCGDGNFTCYNRECVDKSYQCTDEPACTDRSHNTFLHAFCEDENGAPIQQDGFWANDFDSGLHGIEIDSGWVLASKVEAPLVGPPSDHTHSGPNAAAGKFIHTIISPANRTAKMTLEQLTLVAEENCLSFWYYMDGADPGQLTVEWDNNKVWQRAGSYGAKWLQAQVNLFCTFPPCKNKVTFTAGKSLDPNTRISIDDISLLPGVCPLYDGDITEDGWPTKLACRIPKYGQMTCDTLILPTYATSLFVSHGSCLVGTVRFSDSWGNGPDVLTASLEPLKGKGIKLQCIEQRWQNDTVLLKIPVELSVPSKIRLHMSSPAPIGNKQTLQNVHVVDNECENIIVGCYDGLLCSEGRCIKPTDVCDGYNDCTDKRDEENCTECTRGGFLCNNHRCVGPKEVCNGVDDCGDRSDELNCPGAAGSSTGSVVTVVTAVLVAVCGNPYYWG